MAGIVSREETVEGLRVYCDKLVSGGHIEKLEVLRVYDQIYKACIQKFPFDWSEHVYHEHCRLISSLLSSRVMPHFDDNSTSSRLSLVVIKQSSETNLLKLKLLPEHFAQVEGYLTGIDFNSASKAIKKVRGVNKLLCRVTMYIDRYYSRHHKLPKLTDAWSFKLQGLVSAETKAKVMQQAFVVVSAARREGLDSVSAVEACAECIEALGLTGDLEHAIAGLEAVPASAEAPHADPAAAGAAASPATSTAEEK